MIETDVMRGIVGAAVSAIGSSLPVKAPGRVGPTPNDQKYYELVLLQDSNENVSWGNEEVYSGILRIILHWPKDDRGVYDPIETLSALKVTLFKGRIIWEGGAKLLISDNPGLMDMIEEPAEVLYPLSVTYRYFHVPV